MGFSSKLSEEGEYSHYIARIEAHTPAYTSQETDGTRYKVSTEER
jgi:hypothetical protein